MKKTTNPLLASQANVRAGFFETGLYYKFREGFLIGDEAAIDAGQVIQFGYVKNSLALQSLQSKVRFEASTIVIETYSPIEVKPRSKVVIEDKTLVVKAYDEVVIRVSPVAVVVKYTIVLG